MDKHGAIGAFLGRTTTWLEYAAGHVRINGAEKAFPTVPFCHANPWMMRTPFVSTYFSDLTPPKFPSFISVIVPNSCIPSSSISVRLHASIVRLYNLVPISQLNIYARPGQIPILSASKKQRVTSTQSLSSQSPNSCQCLQ